MDIGYWYIDIGIRVYIRCSGCRFRGPVSWIYTLFMQDICINMRKVSDFTVAVYDVYV